jgi:hypothetical protein
MDPNNTYQQKQYLSPYQQEQVIGWKTNIKKALMAAWPYFMRFMNEFMLLMFNVIRGTFRIVKEQLFKS